MDSQKHVSYLIHENIEDAGGDRKRQESEEKGEEPGRGIHGSVETLGSKMDVELWKLLLRNRRNMIRSLEGHQN